LHIIHCHASVDAVEAGVGDLGYALVCAVSGFEVPIISSVVLYSNSTHNAYSTAVQ
jgi:hypothetical protein